MVFAVRRHVTDDPEQPVAEEEVSEARPLRSTESSHTIEVDLGGCTSTRKTRLLPSQETSSRRWGGSPHVQSAPRSTGVSGTSRVTESDATWFTKYQIHPKASHVKMKRPDVVARNRSVRRVLSRKPW